MVVTSSLSGNHLFYISSLRRGFARRGNLNINTSSPDLLKQGDGDPRGKYIVIE